MIIIIVTQRKWNLSSMMSTSLKLNVEVFTGGGKSCIHLLYSVKTTKEKIWVGGFCVAQFVGHSLQCIYYSHTVTCAGTRPPPVSTEDLNRIKKMMQEKKRNSKQNRVAGYTKMTETKKTKRRMGKEGKNVKGKKVKGKTVEKKGPQKVLY